MEERETGVAERGGGAGGERGRTKPPPCIPYTEHTSDGRRDLWNTNKPQRGLGAIDGHAPHILLSLGIRLILLREFDIPPLTPAPASSLHKSSIQAEGFKHRVLDTCP